MELSAHVSGYTAYTIWIEWVSGMLIARNATRTTHQKDIMMIMGTIAFLAPRSMEATECEYASRQ